MSHYYGVYYVHTIHTKISKSMPLFGSVINWDLMALLAQTEIIIWLKD